MNTPFPIPTPVHPGYYDMMEFPAGLEGRIILVEDDEETHASFDPGELEPPAKDGSSSSTSTGICY